MAPHELTALEAVGVGIRAEIDASDVYSELASRVSNPFLQHRDGFSRLDPCFPCATHALPGEMPLEIQVLDSHGKLLMSRKRGRG